MSKWDRMLEQVGSHARASGIACSSKWDRMLEQVGSHARASGIACSSKWDRMLEQVGSHARASGIACSSKWDRMLGPPLHSQCARVLRRVSDPTVAHTVVPLTHCSFTKRFRQQRRQSGLRGRCLFPLIVHSCTAASHRIASHRIASHRMLSRCGSSRRPCLRNSV